MKQFLRYTIYGVVVAVMLIGIAIITPSYFNDGTPWYIGDTNGLVDGDLIDTLLVYHEVHPAFAPRQFVWKPVRMIANSTPISTTVSFLLVQAFYIITSVIALLYAARTVVSTLSKRQELLTLLGYVGSFSIVFAYGIPIYAYDDFAQYTFLFLAFACGYQRRWVWYAVTCTIALFVRESSILLLPSFGLIFFPGWLTNMRAKVAQLKTTWKEIACVVLPAVLYIIGMELLSMVTPIIDAAAAYASEERLSHIAYNFSSALFTIESLASFVIVCVPALYLLIRMRHRALSRAYVPAVLLVVIINSGITLTMTRAQEARIFALPLILLWPLVGAWIGERYIAWKQGYILSAQRTFLFFIGSGVVYYLTFVLYQPTNGFAFATGYRWYALMLGILILWDMCMVAKQTRYDR